MVALAAAQAPDPIKTRTATTIEVCHPIGAFPSFFLPCNIKKKLLKCIGEKADRLTENRAPSRDSAEEIGEWKQPNGSGDSGYNKEFRRYDDNLQVFVGNIPHSTTEDELKVMV